MSAQVTTHEVGFEPLDSLPGVDSLCVFVGEDERPLRGAAGFLDWRLGGALSRVLVSGFFVGAPADTLLLPTGGRIAIPRVFAIGVGRWQTLTEEGLAAAMKTAAQVLDRARAQSVALELPGAGVLQDSARAQALKGSFLPAFAGARVAVLGEKGLGKIL
ncbi:MAG TPA: M17 family peptidase N-terminal domain-containing protein [Myxococcaceae bacterium]|nr:M17 family peptidase N-terminal domain-containing protein [Myxococcaceae bacterium]